VKPGIGVHDKLLLWGGGLWDWFDPETLLRAMEGLKDSRPDIKLLFMGVHPPDRDGGPPAMALRVMELAEKSGLMDRTVFFNKDWVPFDKRADYLLESDLAVCVSPGSLENAYSFRTRLVDALWAGLPIVCTRGGSMADFVELHDVGLCTRPGDADQLRDCLLRALEPDAQSRFRANIGLCQRLLRWDKCAEPLVEFCQKVEDGRFQPRREPAWLPILQYAYYKITSQAEKILEILSGN
jgi:glycosyltransferase involved in cell wall biosynthesis